MDRHPEDAASTSKMDDTDTVVPLINTSFNTPPKIKTSTFTFYFESNFSRPLLFTST